MNVMKYIKNSTENNEINICHRGFIRLLMDYGYLIVILKRFHYNIHLMDKSLIYSMF